MLGWVVEEMILKYCWRDGGVDGGRGSGGVDGGRGSGGRSGEDGGDCVRRLWWRL